MRENQSAWQLRFIRLTTQSGHRLVAPQGGLHCERSHYPGRDMIQRVEPILRAFREILHPLFQNGSECASRRSCFTFIYKVYASTIRPKPPEKASGIFDGVLRNSRLLDAKVQDELQGNFPVQSHGREMYAFVEARRIPFDLLTNPGFGCKDDLTKCAHFSS